MAKVLLDPQIGDLAYPAYQPNQAGRVIALVEVTISHYGGTPYTRAGVRLRLRNGKTVDTASPQDFNALVEDHRRKYEKFLAIKTELENLGR